jgi:hypothetical protein
MPDFECMHLHMHPGKAEVKNPVHTYKVGTISTDSIIFTTYNIRSARHDSENMPRGIACLLFLLRC